MPAGRKRKPVEQQRRLGNPGKRRLPDPVTFAGELARPADLPKEAAALWDELVPLLERSGIGEPVDRPALQAMCVQWALGEKARRVLREDGLFALGSTGQIVEHPAVAMMTRAHMLFLRFAEQYGLTAAARARIAAVLDPELDARERELARTLEQSPVEV